MVKCVCQKLLNGVLTRGLVLGLTLGWSGLLCLGWSPPAVALPQIALPLSFFDSPTPYLAQAANSVEDLQRQQQRKDEERSRLKRQQSQLEGLERSAQRRLGGLQQSIRATTTQISQNQAKLKAANQDLVKLETQLAKAEKGYQGKQSATVARLKFLQRQQGSRGWALLLESENLNEFLDRRYQLRRVYQSDRTVLAQLQKAAMVIEQQRRQVERQKNEVALLTQELQAQKAEYQAQAESQQELIKRLRQDQAALEAAEEQLARDSQNLSVLIQRLSRGDRSRIAVRGTGKMGFPSIGEITSSFGYRLHPILGYNRFHAGMDFGADTGSPIYAADSGVVIFSGWYGGFGQAVILDHGNSLTTLYAHSSELYVSEGQSVQRGQVIAAIGSTGLSTGPHLHFEVRKNGEPVDPMKYL
jgi:murein DD-endopeptidase MepM/ murein hydrolase activator NlpD